MTARVRQNNIPAVAGLVVAILLVSACALSAQPRASALLGPPVMIGNGYARSYVTVDSAGVPISLGITMTEGVLSGLPATAPAGMPDYEYILPLPAGVSVPPYTHIAIDWNPQGHEPPQLYGVPHFDFHFYMISQEERNQITAIGEDLARVERKPPSQFVPKGYMWTPGGVPHMGAHRIPLNAPELHGGKFANTFIYGFYNGQMAFIEPMVTVAYLQTHPSFYSPVPVPTRYAQPGYYPTGYAVVYNPRQARYVIALTGLMQKP